LPSGGTRADRGAGGGSGRGAGGGAADRDADCGGATANGEDPDVGGSIGSWGTQPKETLVQRYLEDVVVDCGEPHRQVAELVLFLLTDERGTRPLKTRPELLQDLKTLGVWEFASNAVMDQRNLDLVLHIICNSGIGVQLPDKPDDRYQLIHDYLAAVIREQQAPQLDKILEALEKETTERLKAEAQKDLLSKANKTLENAAKKARNRVKIASSLLASSIFISTAFMAFTTHFSSQRISSANTIIDLEKELKRISQDLENLTTPSRVEQLELLIKTLLVSGETLDLEQAVIFQMVIALQTQYLSWI
jgi:hypothetical protein